MSRRSRRGLYLRDGIWHIDKQIQRFRLRESTGCSEAEKAMAEEIFDRRVSETRAAIRFGIRPRRSFRDAAAKYLEDFADRRGISRDADALADLDPFIGSLQLERIHNDTFTPYREARRIEGPKGRPLTISTINRNVSVAGKILNLAARLWRHPNGLSWLETPPLIVLPKDPRRRAPYPLDWAEQRLLFAELAPHLERMALFSVNTGARDQELCGLKWEWERRVAELDTDELERSVFLLPAEITKNREARVLVLNDVAQSVVDQVRGDHGVYVFTFVRCGIRDRLDRFRNSGWKNARRRAAAKYQESIGERCPEGFRRIRVQDLRHTFGRRLRAAGVSLEDRQDLLGHKAGRITTHYSAAELGNLIDAANRVENSRKTPTLTLLKVR